MIAGFNIIGRIEWMNWTNERMHLTSYLNEWIMSNILNKLTTLLNDLNGIEWMNNVEYIERMNERIDWTN